MNRTKRFFRKLGIISVPALCVYAIVGAVAIPLLLFETGASKEYNNVAEERSNKFWTHNFAKSDADTLKNNFEFKEFKDQFEVDGRKSSVFELTDKDGTVINKDSHKLMIFTHGLNSTHWNAMESAFYWSLMGYRVISWDQRGGGQNRASHITFGYSEADDLSNLYQTVIDNKETTDTDGAKSKPYDKVKNIVVYGQSNGAATTISFADRYQDLINDAKNKNIKTSFIEESGYTSPKRQFNTALNLHGIMPVAIVPLTIPMYELYADKNLSDADADYLAKSENIQQPLFIAHGDADPIVDYQMGVDLYNKMKNDPKNSIKPSIQIGKGLGHIGLSRDSKLNGADNNIIDEVKALFGNLKIIGNVTKDKAIEDGKKVFGLFEDSIKTKSLVKYPVAVRFFYNVFMWSEYGINTEELGDK